MPKQIWPAPERNKAPILELLRRVLPASGRLLEIASGTGQHAAYFAQELAGLEYQPTDVSEPKLASISSHVADARLANLRLPFALDVMTADWGVGTVDAVYCANMVHIAPWACAIGLMKGAGRHLRAGGVLVVYGPFRVGSAHTSASNEDFDADLKRRDPTWGVRDVEALESLGREAGLELVERVAMPANNQSLVFRRTSSRS